MINKDLIVGNFEICDNRYSPTYDETSYKLKPDLKI